MDGASSTLLKAQGRTKLRGNPTGAPKVVEPGGISITSELSHTLFI